MHDLKDGADIVQLIKKTKECAGEVILHTGEGDKLNLKSTLSQYVCVAMVAKPEILLRSSIIRHSALDIARGRMKLPGRYFYVQMHAFSFSEKYAIIQKYAYTRRIYQRISYYVK